MTRTEVFLDKYRPYMPDYLSELEMGAREHNIPVIGRGTGDIIRYICRTVNPENVLEIGTAIGFSALFIRECIPENAHITTIEKIESRYEQAEINFKNYDKKGQITLIKEDALDTIERLLEEKKKYGVIFLDAAKGQYITFFPILAELLEREGVLITDNVFHGGTVMNSRFAVTQRDRTIHTRLREYLQTITEDERFESVILPIDDGIAISRKTYRGKNSEKA
ncbi:MAG: O-methyltransferase [Eubacterium sp.]|nr:O-methyltransferase [Eubacterium sp.]